MTRLRSTDFRDRMIRGFTLIEVMVVVLIIGVLYGLAVFTIGSPRADALEQTARTLEANLQLASEEAVIRATVIGFRLRPDGYEFLMPGEDEWVPPTDDRLLRPRRWESFIEAELRGPAVEAAEEEPQGDDDALRPEILFVPTGVIPEFTLTLSGERDDPTWQLTVAADGTLKRQRIE